MKYGKLTNKELDALGKSVVRSAMLDGGEIDRISSKHGLYDGVLQKIGAVETKRRKPSFWRSWSPAVVSLGFIAVVSLTLAGIFSSRENETSRARIIYTVDEDTRSFEPRVPSAPDPIQRRYSGSLSPEPTVYNRPPEKRAMQNRRQPQPKTPRLPEADFQPIGFSSNVEDALLDGRVVRVEMPRSALFSLGVDLPLENGTKAVKADLLVGSDGTPRGIRLVE